MRTATLLLLLLPGCLSFAQRAVPHTPKGQTFAELPGLRIRYRDSGPATGSTVVLIHGFAASLEEWYLVEPLLAAAGHRVINLDMKGHGLSDRPEGDYSIDGHARLVFVLLDHLGIENVDLIGHSWGSAVAVRMAELAPKRVRRVAIYSGMFFDDQLPLMFSWSKLPGLGELLFAVFYRERLDEKISFAFVDSEKFITEQYVENQHWVLDRPGAIAAHLATVRGMDFAALGAGLATLEQPVLILWGREDQVTPLAYGERLYDSLPNARLRVYPQCGHLPMAEAVAPSTRDLLAFLAADEP